MYNSHIQYVIDLSDKLKNVSPYYGNDNFHYHISDVHGDIFSLSSALVKSGFAKCDGHVFVDVRTELEVENVNNQFITAIPNLTVNPNFKGVWTVGGDLIDRGAYSMECVLIMNRIYKQTRFKMLNFNWLIGNHELLLYQNDFENSYYYGFNAPNNLEREYFNLMRNIFIVNLESRAMKTCCYVSVTGRVVSHAVLTNKVVANPNLDYEDLCEQLNDAIANVDFTNPLLNDVFATRTLVRKNDELVEYRKHALLPQVVGHDGYWDEEYRIIQQIQKEYPMVIFTDNYQSEGIRKIKKEKGISCLFIGKENGIYERRVEKQI
jgi:hypothetical protein